MQNQNLIGYLKTKYHLYKTGEFISCLIFSYGLKTHQNRQESIFISYHKKYPSNTIESILASIWFILVHRSHIVTIILSLKSSHFILSSVENIILKVIQTKIKKEKRYIIT
nr:MAG TPA: hypothetical protein [Bacteriophage sp.]